MVLQRAAMHIQTLSERAFLIWVKDKATAEPPTTGIFAVIAEQTAQWLTNNGIFTVLAEQTARRDSNNG
ncbi:hypothetical protein, partial [Paenibacillus sp. 22594]|uniref:hypothetical protein n=1 Tax=Paenibacillus sp. 22594 TaxID=3453947 RepID=UPI003F87D507